MHSNKFYLILILTLFIANACQQKTNNLVISVDKVQIESDGKDLATFTVKYNDRDVTEQSQIIAVNPEYPISGNRFSSTRSGDYYFFGKYGDFTTEPIRVTALGSLRIYADTTVVTARGKEEIHLTAKQNGIDVTDKCIFYLFSGKEKKNLAVIEANWNPAEPGFFYIYAQKGEKTSDSLFVLSLPPDSEPENYSDFEKRLLMLMFTSQGCGYSPIMRSALDRLYEEGWNKGVEAVCHTTIMKDSLYPPFWKELWNSYSPIDQIPNIGYDLHRKDYVTAYKTVEKTIEKIRQTTDSIISVRPAQSALSVAVFPGNCGKEAINVYVRVKSIGDRPVFIGAWLLENGVKGYQKNYFPEMIPDGNLSIHNRLIVDLSENNSRWQHFLPQWKKEQEFRFSFDTHQLHNGKPQDCTVIVFSATEQNDGTMIIDNATDCPYYGFNTYQYKH